MNPVNRWRLIAALLGACCIALVYRVFDQGITRTYLDASQETSVQHVKILNGLVRHEWIGLPEAEVMSRLKAYAASQPPGSVVLKSGPEENSIYLEGTRFEFRDGSLINVM